MSSLMGVLDGVEFWGAAIGIAAAFMGGVVQGCAGFGLGLTVAPCLMLVVVPAVAVPTVLSLSIVNSLLVTLHARRHLHYGTLVPLVLGGLVGIPIGIQILRFVNPVTLKVVTGAFVVVVTLTMLQGWSRPLARPGRALLPLGVLSGILNASMSMGGPPIVLFLANQDTPKDQFRASLISFFFFASCYAVALQAFSGLYTSTVVTHTALFVAPLLCGTYCGVSLSRHVPEQVFRRAVLIGVGCMGCVLLVTSLRAVIFP